MVVHDTRYPNISVTDAAVTIWYRVWLGVVSLVGLYTRTLFDRQHNPLSVSLPRFIARVCVRLCQSSRYTIAPHNSITLREITAAMLRLLRK